MNTETEDKGITTKDIASGFGILFRLLARYKREMFIFITLGIIAAVGNASIPYVVGTFIDALVSPTNTFQAWGFVAPLYLVVLGLWAFVKITLVYVEDHLGRHSDNQGMKIYAEYLTNSFSHVLQLPLSFHKKHKMGEVFQKINMTADNIESIVAGTIIQLGPQILSIFVAFAITFYINVILGSFLLGMVLVYLFIFIHGIEPLAKIQSEMYKAGAEVWGDVWDYMENTRQVKEAVAEERVANRLFDGFRNRIVRIWSRMHFASADLSLHQQLIILLSQFFIFVYSIYAIIGGTMTIGELLAVNGYAQMIFGPFVIIGRTWKNVQNGIININETEKLLAVPEEAYVPRNVVPLSEIRGDVTFTNVDFYYTKNTPVLKNISFEVRQGETVAIVGESGVGKTTLVDLLLGFYFPSKGIITVDGVNIKRLDLKQLRGSIAVVSQDIILFNESIEHNIAFGGKNVTPSTLKNAAEKADALKFIKRFPNKWKQVVGERGIKLSGGQRQRIALARAILADPKILVLDEPTSSLDARAEKRIQTSLAEIMKGKTTFIIAHRLSTVRNADKIIVLKDGGIVETGTHKQLIKRKKGEYRALYELQIGLHE